MTVAQGTPRTDAASAEYMFAPAGSHPYERLINFARELERENAALSAQVVELQKELIDLHVEWAQDLIDGAVDSTVTRVSVPPSVKDSGT